MTYQMTEDHKQKLAEGRRQSAAVRAYLEVLDEYKPRRGRRKDKERLSRRLEEINSASSSDLDPLERLKLLSEKEQIVADLARFDNEHELEEARNEFVRHAASYAERQNLTYRAFREVGVPAEVLKEAGIDR